jgi:dTDP-4-dehydrorhamnose 3,5-epimerase
VRCTKGAVFDVIVDLRSESPTYLDQLVVVPSTENARGLYVPKRFAHGLITLEDSTELTYLISESHTPNAEGGLRYDDPMLGVDWPLPVRVVSPRDTARSLICEIEDGLRFRMSLDEAAYS